MRRGENLKRINGPGHGRPKGRRDDRTLSIQAFAQSVVEHPDARARLTREFLDGTMPPVLQVELFNRAYGKVKDMLAVESVKPVVLELIGAAVAVAPTNGNGHNGNGHNGNGDGH